MVCALEPSSKFANRCYFGEGAMAEGLFVASGAAIATSSTQIPSLPHVALSARMARHQVELLKAAKIWAEPPGSALPYARLTDFALG